MNDTLLLDRHHRDDVPTLNGMCQFVLANSLPAEFGILISEVTVHFFYSDFTLYVSGPTPVNLRSGNSTSVYSFHGEKCVRQVYVVVDLNTPEFGRLRKEGGTPPSAEGRCYRKAKIELDTVSTISECDLYSNEFSDFLELKFIN